MGKEALFLFCVVVFHLWLAVTASGGTSIETKNGPTQKDTAPFDGSGVESSTPRQEKDVKRIDDDPDDDIVADPTESKEVSSDESSRQDSAERDPSLRYGERVRSGDAKTPDTGTRLRMLQAGNPRPFQRPNTRFRGQQTIAADSTERSQEGQEPAYGGNDRPGQEPRPYAGVPQQPRPLLRSTFARPFDGGPFPQQANPLLRAAFARPSNGQVFYNGAANPLAQSAANEGSFNNQAFFNGAAGRPPPSAFRNGPPLNGQVLFNRPQPRPFAQNALFSVPPRNFYEFGDPRTRAQFPISNEIPFSNFQGSPQGGALRLASSASPSGFQLFPGGPQVQSQPILVQPQRSNLQQQQQRQQQSPFGFPESLLNFGLVDDFPVPDFSAFGQSQGLYDGMGSSEAVDDFNNAAFFPNYLTTGDVIRVTPPADGDQQQAPDTSREEAKSSKETADQKSDQDANERQDSAPYGARFQVPNGADVFMRYPVSEAGYAIEERNLPSANDTTRATPEGPSAEGDIRNAIFSRNPYRDALNGTRNFNPEDIFRDVPIDFGYQRPPAQPVFVMEYPDRARDIGQFQPLQLQPLAYPFLNGASAGRQEARELDVQPACAKESNSSFCFEDEAYPWSDVLYSLNTNSFLMDRMSGPNQEVNATAFLGSGAEGKYACDADTRTGKPLRGRSLGGTWRVIVNAQRFAQVVRMEVCRSEGDPCSNIQTGLQTSCVQKHSVQRLLAWSPDRGLFSDLFRVPVACSCQVL